MLISPCFKPQNSPPGPFVLKNRPVAPAALMLDATRRQPSGEDPVNAVRTVKSSAATPEKLVPETSRMTPSLGRKGRWAGPWTFCWGEHGEFWG